MGNCFEWVLHCCSLIGIAVKFGLKVFVVVAVGAIDPVCDWRELLALSAGKVGIKQATNIKFASVWRSTAPILISLGEIARRIPLFLPRILSIRPKVLG